MRGGPIARAELLDALTVTAVNRSDVAPDGSPRISRSPLTCRTRPGAGELQLRWTTVPMTRLTETDHRYRYSVAWIDLLAKGASTGRAVLTRGEHAELDQLSPAQRRDPLAFRPGSPGSIHAPGAMLDTPPSEVAKTSTPLRRVGWVTS